MFGFSFGKNKTNTSETATKNESSTQNTSGTKNSTSTGSSSTTGSQSNQSSGSSQTSQGTSGTSTQTSGGTSFGNAALSGINDNIGGFIDRILGGGAGGAAISELGSFNAEDFIANTMRAATATATDQLGEGVRGLASGIGGNAAENSMSALLANRMENATAANLAGVRGQAETAAQGILTQRANTIAGAAGQEQNALAQILNAIKGGESSQTQTGQSNQNTTGNTSTSESGNQQSSQNQQTTQSVVELISQLLKNDVVSVGTSQGSQSKSGGGFSLSL